MHLLNRLLPSCLLAVAGLFLAGTTVPNDWIELIRRQLDKYNTYYPQEKVYLHVDKPHYALGENLWFSAYLVDGRNHRRQTLSNVVHVELIAPNDSLLAERYIRMEEGVGAGDFDLNPEWPAGPYVLRAYTQLMRNFDSAFLFQQTLPVFDTYSAGAPGRQRNDEPPGRALNGAPAGGDFSVQFFPEGGDLVLSLSSVVGVKAVDADGQGIPVKGKILDEEDRLVTFFESLQFGLGFFSLRPEAGRRYRAEITYGETTRSFSLPVIQTSGYILRVDNRRDDVLSVSAATNISGGMQGAFIIGQMRGAHFCTITADGTRDLLAAEVPKSGLPDGVAHFTLFTGQGEPVCERLVFLQQPANQTQLTVTSDQAVYGKRRPVTLQLALTDADGRPLGGDVSVAVTDQYAVPRSPHGQDIRTYLLLNSDLRGQIENPGYYFEENTPGRRRLLDLLMLSQGWRRFVWRDLMADQFPDIQHLAENGFTIAGTTIRPGRPEEPLAAEVYISTFSGEFISAQMSTGDDGLFSFSGFQFPDTTDVVLQANLLPPRRSDRRPRKDGEATGPSGNRNVDFVLRKTGIPPVDRRLAFPASEAREASLAELLADARRIQTVDSAYHDLWRIDLEGLVVRGNRVRSEEKRIDRPGMLYGEPSNRLILDSLPGGIPFANNVFELIQGRIPGVQVNGIPPNQSFLIRGPSSILGSNEALVLIDGIPSDNAALAALSIYDIEFIDVLKGGAATMYGARGATGVVAVYTRRGSRPGGAVQGPQPGLRAFQHPGFYKARQFYAPAYDRKRPEHDRPDYRITLFWQPRVRLDAQGRASLTFYTSDKLSQYQVVAEGLSSDGRPLRGEQMFTVNEE